MIELTEQQLAALQTPGAAPPRVVNPHTKETFVLLRLEEYQRLTQGDYDDSPWTREELEAQAWEVSEGTGWDALGEDDQPREP
jgi:hypothetical protein